MLSEEEKKAIEYFKGRIVNKKTDYTSIYFKIERLELILNLIEKQQKKLNNIKEIEQSHKEENGKLRVELEQEKNKINTIKKLMSVGDITDEALFTLIQTTMAELERLEDVEEKLDEEKEKNSITLSDLLEYKEELTIEKEKNKELKSSIDYLQKIEPEKLKIIVDSWNEKVMTNFEKEWICKDKIKEKLNYQYMLWNTPNRQKEYNQEVVEVLEDLLEEK